MTNPIADPLVEGPDSDLLSDLVTLEATPQGAVTVTINRAEKKNAFNAEVIAALLQTFETLHGQEHVRIVFLAGAGDAFSAGADLAWMRQAVDWDEERNRDDAMQLARMLKALHDIPALTVALVDGAAFGGGAGLVAACDMAVATPNAKFSFSEVRLGLTPATISPYVVAAVGPRNAKVLFATARVFGAEEALHFGLVHELVPDAATMAVIKDALAAGMLDCAPGAVADAKALVDHVAAHRLDHGLMEETAKRIAARRVSDEGQEGVRAFLDRRKPGWAEV